MTSYTIKNLGRAASPANQIWFRWRVTIWLGHSDQVVDEQEFTGTYSQVVDYQEGLRAKHERMLEAATC